jgi:enoyl-CoA hydratase
VVFLATGARLGDQHAQYGLYPAWGASVRLPRLLGRRRALDLMYSARWLDAGEAHAWGLASHVVADDVLLDEAQAYAARLAARSPGANAFVKRMCETALERGLDEALAAEAAGAAAGLRTPHCAEGLAAFRERRDPRFD